MERGYAERDQIISDEGGNRQNSYYDSEGYLTGGIGHLMDLEEQQMFPEGCYIPSTIREEWFRKDFETAISDAEYLLDNDVPDEVFNIVTNMAFNLGLPRLSKFRKMFLAIQEYDWEKAAAEMMNSRWYYQVGSRSKRLVERMRNVC